VNPWDRFAKKSAPWTLAAFVWVAACTRTPAPGDRLLAPRPQPSPAPRSNGVREPLRPPVATVLPARDRVIAVGDVHGDVDALRAALRVARVIDATGRWTGGHAAVVQLGDLLDRGDQERAVIDLATTLGEQAERAGGLFVPIDGNHEIMNSQGDFRYVTPGGFRDFADVVSLVADPGVLAMLERAPAPMRGRVAAFAPGGTYARQLAAWNIVQVVGDTVFVHGGLLPEHVRHGFDALNREVRAFFLGAATLPAYLTEEQSPVWLRRFALDDDPATCALAAETLRAASARRMVVAHTVQREGITSACGGTVWRVDVGLSRAYGGPVQVLEIARGAVSVLTGER